MNCQDLVLRNMEWPILLVATFRPLLPTKTGEVKETHTMSILDFLWQTFHVFWGFEVYWSRYRKREMMYRHRLEQQPDDA